MGFRRLPSTGLRTLSLSVGCQVREQLWDFGGHPAEDAALSICCQVRTRDRRHHLEVSRLRRLPSPAGAVGVRLSAAAGRHAAYISGASLARCTRWPTPGHHGPPLDRCRGWAWTDTGLALHPTAPDTPSETAPLHTRLDARHMRPFTGDLTHQTRHSGTTRLDARHMRPFTGDLTHQTRDSGPDTPAQTAGPTHETNVKYTFLTWKSISPSKSRMLCFRPLISSPTHLSFIWLYN